MPYDRDKVARAIKIGRAAKELTQEQLGDQAGLSAVSINAYENRTAVPSFESAVKIAEALGITVNDLCGLKAGE